MKPSKGSERETRPATESDIGDVVVLLNKVSRRFGGDEDMTESRLRREWTEPGFDLERDTRILADLADGVIGYADYFNNNEPFVRPFAYVTVDPDHLDSVSGANFVTWAEERARADLSKAPDGSRFSLLGGVELKNKPVQAAWQAAGFVESRRFYHMRIDFNAPSPPAIVPEGFELRRMNDGEEWEMFVAMEEAFEDHFGFVKADSLESEFKHWKHHFLDDPDYDPDLQIIAVDSRGQIAGMSMNRPKHGPDEEMGWVSSLAVCRAHRQKGLGEALLRRTFELFYNKGKKRAGLGVDAESLTNATRLYEKCGMRQSKVFVQVEKMLRDGEELANLGT